MRFLADESCDFSVVRALRSAGHDVIAVHSELSGADDERISQFAQTDGRILVTEDKDFGQIVFAASRQTPGVILIRYPANLRQDMCDAVLRLADQIGEDLHGRFAVVQPGRVRISRHET